MVAEEKGMEATVAEVEVEVDLEGGRLHDLVGKGRVNLRWDGRAARV